MKKKILITTLIAIAVCIGYFATLAYQDKEDVGNEEMVQGEEVDDTEEPADEIEKTLAPIVEPALSPTIAPTEVAKTEEPIIRTETPLVETKEPVVSTTEPTVIPTIEPTKEAVTKKPTVEPTKAATKKPVITETPTKAPTKKPTIEPATKPTVKPTVKPTAKPVKTPTPTKKASKTYWYEVPTEYGFDYIESNLSPDKYPVPEGYQPWNYLGAHYDNSIGAEVYWTQLLPKENVLAYNKDGSPNLKDTYVYSMTNEFFYFILDSKELQSYLKSKGITDVRKISAYTLATTFGANSVRSKCYQIEHDNSYNGGYLKFYFDNNYNVTEENPYD